MIAKAKQIENDGDFRSWLNTQYHNFVKDGVN